MYLRCVQIKEATCVQKMNQNDQHIIQKDSVDILSKTSMYYLAEMSTGVSMLTS